MTLPYIITVALFLATCLAFYKVLLRRETFYKVNRYMLIGCLAISFALPLLPIPKQFSLRLPNQETKNEIRRTSPLIGMPVESPKTEMDNTKSEIENSKSENKSAEPLPASNNLPISSVQIFFRTTDRLDSLDLLVWCLHFCRRFSVAAWFTTLPLLV